MPARRNPQGAIQGAREGDEGDDRKHHVDRRPQRTKLHAAGTGAAEPAAGTRGPAAGGGAAGTQRGTIPGPDATAAAGAAEPADSLTAS